MSLRATMGLQKESTARSFLWFTASIVIAWWFTVGLLMLFADAQWSTWEGFMTWGRDLCFASIGGYALNEIGTGIGSRGAGDAE